MAATPPVCDFGWPAIDAILPGTDGHDHRISALAGPGGLVVAVSSNDAVAYPEDSFDNMRRFAEQHRIPFPYLHDEDQRLARAYGAACTPDFFGFNAALELQYRGRLDASRKEEGPPDLRRDLHEAMVQVANCGHGPDRQIASIGCSIKWKEGA